MYKIRCLVYKIILDIGYCELNKMMLIKKSYDKSILIFFFVYINFINFNNVVVLIFLVCFCFVK